MAENCPVQTSAVYVLGRNSRFAMPPPSPPSPRMVADKDDGLCTPIQELSLDSIEGSEGSAMKPADSTESGDGDAASSASISRSSSSSASSSCAQAMSSSASASASAGMHRPSLSSPITTAPATAAGSPLMTAADLDSCESDGRLAGAIHVLATEANALQSVAKLYGSSASARDGFNRAVEAIVQTQTAYPAGKLVIVGVGKSGHIARKLAATFNSLAVPASFLHPTEALHGDLGHIRPNDALLFITYSGKTQELVSLLPHVDPALPLILLTAHVTTETCALVQHRQEFHRSAKAVGPTILLPAPIPVEEVVSFGVSAPTTSTTTALAVGDALAIVAGNELHLAVGGVGPVFKRNHPGGAIGETTRKQAGPSAGNEHIRHLAVPWSSIPVVKADDAAVCADVLHAGYNNAAARGWVRVVGRTPGDASADGVAPPSRIRALAPADLSRPVADVAGLVVSHPDFVVVSADTKTRSAAEWLRRLSRSTAGSGAGLESSSDVVIAVVDHANGGELVGLLELNDLLET